MTETFTEIDLLFLGSCMQAVIELMRQRLAGNPSAALGDLIASLREPADEAEVRFAVLDRVNHRQDGAAAVAAFTDFVTSPAAPSGWSLAPMSYEGCRVDVPGGWVLLRQSLHDPVVVLNVESGVPGGAGALRDALREGWAERVKDKLDIQLL